MLILDICCGFPNPSEPYTKRGDLGVDIVPGYADVLADAHNLPFRDSVFESAGIYYALDHLFRPVQVLTEARRVIKDYLIVANANVDHWGASINSDSPEHYYNWNHDTLPQLLGLCGFYNFKLSLVRIRRSKRFKELMVEMVVSLLYRKKPLNRFFSEIIGVKAYKTHAREQEMKENV